MTGFATKERTIEREMKVLEEREEEEEKLGYVKGRAIV